VCVAVPMRVVEVGEFDCVAEIDGVRKSANTMTLDDVKVGDYIMVHAGFAIARLDPVTAEETLALMRQIVDMEGGEA